VKFRSVDEQFEGLKAAVRLAVAVDVVEKANQVRVVELHPARLLIAGHPAKGDGVDARIRIPLWRAAVLAVELRDEREGVEVRAAAGQFDAGDGSHVASQAEPVDMRLPVVDAV